MPLAHIKWYKETDSTNFRLAMERDTAPQGQIFAAMFQSEGRGQRGNTWESRAGENLTFSILLKPSDIYLREQFCISQAVALGVVAWLGDKGVDARIKWPNDIYVGDKKICGILIENYAQGDLIVQSIAGVGLNLSQTVFSEDVPNATSLSLLTGGKYSPKEELPSLASHILHEYGQIAQGDRHLYLRTDAERRYLELLYRRGEWHFFEEMNPSEIPVEKRSGQRFRARILGIDNSARLLLEDEAGSIRHYFFKEIRYIL